jgi:hypothetical protein
MTIKIQEFLTKRKIFAQQKYKCCEANSEGEQSGSRTLEQKKKKEREREREEERESRLLITENWSRRLRRS